MVFIEGLHYSFSAEGLNKLFAPFGTVLWSRLIVDTNGEVFFLSDTYRCPRIANRSQPFRGSMALKF